MCVTELRSRYFELCRNLMVAYSNIYFSFASYFQDVFNCGHGTLFTLRIPVYDTLHFSRFV